MLHRNTEPETEPYYCLPIGAVLSHWSQPTSPAPGSTRTFPLSPTHSTPRHSIPKNDDGTFFNYLQNFNNFICGNIDAHIVYVYYDQSSRSYLFGIGYNFSPGLVY